MNNISNKVIIPRIITNMSRNNVDITLVHMNLCAELHNVDRIQKKCVRTLMMCRIAVLTNYLYNMLNHNF